jgi:hypothetical protein
MGSARASCSGQADIAEKAIAYDGQNDVVTGGGNNEFTDKKRYT